MLQYPYTYMTIHVIHVNVTHTTHVELEAMNIINNYQTSHDFTNSWVVMETLISKHYQRVTCQLIRFVDDMNLINKINKLYLWVTTHIIFKICTCIYIVDVCIYTYCRYTCMYISDVYSICGCVCVWGQGGVPKTSYYCTLYLVLCV